MDHLYRLFGLASMAGEGKVSGSPSVRSPVVCRLVKQSPMTMELGAAAATGGLTLAVFRVMSIALRDPESLGSFFPKIKTAWYDARVVELEARKRLEEVRRLGGEVTVELVNCRAASLSRIHADEDVDVLEHYLE